MIEPTIETLNRYILLDEGYIMFAHVFYTVDELAADIIDFAIKAGMPVDVGIDDRLDHIGEDPDWRDSMENEAIDYLNTHHCPEGAWWGHDGYAGAFGCWPNTKDNA